jgi:hypothetical protein
MNGLRRDEVCMSRFRSGTCGAATFIVDAQLLLERFLVDHHAAQFTFF